MASREGCLKASRRLFEASSKRLPGLGFEGFRAFNLKALILISLCSHFDLILPSNTGFDLILESFAGQNEGKMRPI